VISDSSTGTNYGRVDTVRKARSPPATIAEAMVIPGSVKVAAEEGAYVPFRITKGSTNAVSDDVYCTRLFMNGANVAQNPAKALYGFGSIAPFASFSAGGSIPLLGHYHPVPFDLSGAYFTGLNTNTTLDVTVRLYIEVLPTQLNQGLLVLSEPCPPADPRALELYSKVIGDLPPGVPVGMNADGSWFKDVLKTIASYAPTIGGALGSVIPGGALIGKGVGKAAEMLAGMKLGENAQKQVDKEKSRIETSGWTAPPKKKKKPRETEPSPQANQPKPAREGRSRSRAVSIARPRARSASAGRRR